MPRLTAIKAEIGTTGDIERIDLTGDAGADIATAIGHEHHCKDDPGCDIARALEDGYPYWSAQLLQSATETPLLDAIVSHYCAQGLDFGAAADSDRVDWLASDTWTEHAHTCAGCGSITFGDDSWTPDACANCGETLPPKWHSKIDAVYVIYSADVVAESTSEIESMSPASHMPAGYPVDSGLARERADIAAKFVQTEDDGQYDYGYLGNESGDVRYFPYGYLDSEGIEQSEDDETPSGLGQHRKWVGELTAAEWETFADSYLIELDTAKGLPEDYTETLGSFTEYGHLPAIAVDNREGWEHGNFGYGPVLGVIDSQMYISFAGPND